MSLAFYAALAALLLATTASARIENLGQPCRARNILAAGLVTDRSDGRERLVLTNMNENSGAELVYIDFEKNEGKVYRAPAGAGSWALTEVPGDRLVVGTFYDGKFMLFDLKKMEFTQTATFAGESYIWNLALGKDGHVYGGTYPGGKLGALDLGTLAVEDMGAPAPPNMYLRTVSAMPDGRILCQFGQEKNTVLIFDPDTKRFQPVPEQLKGVSAGFAWNGYFVCSSRFFKADDLALTDPPFKAPPADKGAWAVHPSAWSDDALVVTQGNRLYVYRKGDEDLTHIADLDLRSCALRAVTAKNEILGTRGQDYFVIKPGDTELRLQTIPGESGPRHTHFLHIDDRDRLWGGPTFGQTLFYMDARSGKTVNTSTICNAGGEVYDVDSRDGKVYAVAYVGGDVVRYDPAEPWDQWNNRNPKTIASVGKSGFIRPIAGIMFGPDGKLYSGWMASYGRYGGAIAITDPETGGTEIIKNPLGEQAVSGLAVDSRFAYVGTNVAGNGLPHKQGEPVSFGIIRLSTKKVVFRKEFEGVSTVRVLGCDEALGRVIACVDRSIRLFDSVKRSFIEGLSGIPPVTSNSTQLVDGSLYYGSEKSIVKLDLATGKASHITDAAGEVNNVTVGKDGKVYFSSGVDVYRVD